MTDAAEAWDERPASEPPPESVDDPPDAWRAYLRLDAKGKPTRSFANLCTIIEGLYGHRLSYDEMAVTPCLDGVAMKDTDFGRIRRNIEVREDLPFAADNIREAVSMAAFERRFHPVQRYLRSLRWDGARRVDRMAALYLGAPDPLSARMVRNWMIAAIARALEPGCKVDNVLVLLSPRQGLKKSMFFDVLGGAWYVDSKIDIGDRKGLLTLHSAWIYEWPEVDHVMARKLDSEIKAFVSQRVDNFVPPYGRGSVTVPRSCILGGTTNEEHFLRDPTGSRRWWIVRVAGKIPVSQLRRERDQLWAEALELYDCFRRDQAQGVEDDDNPCRWWLSDAEEAERERRAESHYAPDPWEETIGKWLRGEPIRCNACAGTGTRGGGESPPPCNACRGTGHHKAPAAHEDRTGRGFRTQAEVLQGALQMPPERHSGASARVAGTLRRLGWLPGEGEYRPRVGGQKVTPYYQPDAWRMVGDATEDEDSHGS